MLPKTRRLSRARFSDVRKSGTKAVGRLVTLQYRCMPTSLGCFSVVVPKLVASRSTARNHVRRFVYHVLKEANTVGVDGIWYIRQKTDTALPLLSKEIRLMLTSAANHCVRVA